MHGVVRGLLPEVWKHEHGRVGFRASIFAAGGRGDPQESPASSLLGGRDEAQ
jgi:hypothetical protein